MPREIAMPAANRFAQFLPALCVALSFGAHGDAGAATSEPALNPLVSANLAGLQGDAAVSALGDQLGRLAARHGKTPQEFAELLRRDSSLRVDAQGRLFVVEAAFDPSTSLSNATPSAPSRQGTPVPLARTFLLHSRPSAKRTIYLNFKGATLTNDGWVGSSTVKAVPFDTDGSPKTFSDAERTTIQYIWQRVAEDFSPFDVDVTTQQPLPDRLTRSNDADDEYGTTALITNNEGVFACGCGGVAYIGVFDMVGDYYKPALVFFNMLGSDEKNIAEAISHEVGHNLNLLHDGYAGGGYYPGQGSGATGWAPIMGVGYYQPVVQWSKGEYATANNLQDDIQVIQDTGLPLRPDDHAATLDTATALRRVVSGATVTFSGNGVIESAGDQDVFRFRVGAGAMNIKISPDSRGPNLDLNVQLLDAKGNVVLSSNPKPLLNAAIRYTAPATGTYYLRISDSGYGDPLTDGYSTYGSLGQYTISGTATAAP
jgi:hypothetical protein